MHMFLNRGVLGCLGTKPSRIEPGPLIHEECHQRSCARVLTRRSWGHILKRRGTTVGYYTLDHSNLLVRSTLCFLLRACSPSFPNCLNTHEGGTPTKCTAQTVMFFNLYFTGFHASFGKSIFVETLLLGPKTKNGKPIFLNPKP